MPWEIRGGSVGNKYHLDHFFIHDPRIYGTTRLYQLGRLHCAADAVIPVHSHLNWFELTVVTGGRGRISTNGVSLPVGRGDIYLSFPGDFHGIVSDRHDPLKYDFFAFFSEEPELRGGFEELIQRNLSAEQRIVRDERVSELVAESIEELGRGGAYSERILSSILEQILCRILRDFGEGDTARGEPEELCYRIMHYIDTHLYTMESLREVADAFSYHYSYLSDLFRKVTSDTLSGYYQARRLEAARLLVMEGRLSVTEIAEHLHYSSIYTFSRAYRDRYGLSPMAYRKREKIKTSREGAEYERHEGL